MTQQPIRVYVVHRMQVLLDVLAESMEDCPEILLAGTATEVGEAVSTLEGREVDLLLIDSKLFHGAVRKYASQPNRRLKIVPLGLVTDRQILEHIEAGASGYVPENASFDQLIETIRGVHCNQAPCSAQVAASVSARMAQLAFDSECREPVSVPEDVKLTPKEEQVLRLAAKGMSNKEIASHLEIALSTVKIHIHRILGKLKVGKRREAILIAHEAGLLQDIAAPAPLQMSLN